jgi:hypothetical protein
MENSKLPEKTLADITLSYSKTFQSLLAYIIDLVNEFESEVPSLSACIKRNLITMASFIEGLDEELKIYLLDFVSPA